MTTSGMLPLSTTRLVLRRFTEADLEPFLVYRDDPDVARYQSWEGCSRTEAETCIGGQQTQEPGVPGQWLRIAIARKEAETLLATVLCTSIAPRLARPP